jgi:DNA (cytosine-5)-methyltransferase 3A
LVLSDSPCQDLSAAGKRAGINGKKSSLFFVFIEILEHIKSLNPNVLFLQENVGSASKLDVGIMSRALGVYPVRINSSLVTAQLRDRYYWSNIKTKATMFDLVTDIPQPKDRGIMFKDIITSGEVERIKALALLESESRAVTSQESIKKRASREFINIIYEHKTYQINPSKESNGIQPYIQNRIYNIKGKAPCLTKEKAHFLKYENEIVRTVNKIEMCRLQGFPDNYCDILTTAKAGSLLGDGWTLPIIEHIFSFIQL